MAGRGPAKPEARVLRVWRTGVMKIAFLNQFHNSAETQAYHSLRIAGERLGHKVIHCANSAEVDACSPDFVLAPASTRPKLNDFPHYGVLHDPRETYLSERQFFNNLRTHDGWLALSGTMRRFARDVAFSLGRDQEIGVYYNSCQRLDVASPLESILRERRLRIAYFGTNWDRRRARLFRMLSHEPGFAICGPRDAWKDIEPAAYCGAPPFDGQSVQAFYAECGAGLCLLSDKHFRDDVISNRVFEVSSAGALCIASAIPWLREHFGDSLYYIDQRLADPQLLKQILDARERIHADPAAALQRAAEARRIFEEKFSAEALLANAALHHARHASRRRTRLDEARQRYNPLISVIIRCGLQPVDMLCRAVESLSRQTYGRFDLILVRHHDIDLSPITAAEWPNIERMRIVESPGGNCSRSLWAGLQAIEGEYFALLDDDDWLFSNHFEELFRPFPGAPQSGFFAFSGSITVEAEARVAMGSGFDNRHLVRYGFPVSDRLEQIAGSIATNGFAASRGLLDEALLIDPEMDTAEDSYLILALVSKTTPRFSHAATSVNEVGHPGRISATIHPRRFEDLFTLHTRMSGRLHPAPGPRDAWNALREEWEHRPAAMTATGQASEGKVVLGDNTFYLSSLEEAELRAVAEGIHIDGSRLNIGCGTLSRFRKTLTLRTPSVPWQYAAELRFKRPKTFTGDLLLRIEIIVRAGRAGLGLLAASGPDYLFRTPLRPRPEVQVINIPIEDLDKAGPLVVQTWDEPAAAELEIKRIRLLTRRDV